MAKVLRRASVRSPVSPEEPPESIPAPRRSVRIGSLALLTVVAVVGVAAGYERATAGHLYPGTRIAGVPVGSRSIEQARALLTHNVVRPLRTETLSIRAHDGLEATAWDMGLRVNVEDAVRSMHERQLSAPLLKRLWYRVFGDGSRSSLGAAIDRDRLESFVRQTAQRIDREARDASVEFEGEGLRVLHHEVGRRVDTQGALQSIVAGLRAGHREIRLPVEITQPALRTEHFAKVILVRTGSNNLDLYLDGRVARSYRVATGTPGYPTPHGQFRITAKRRNPTWGNPWSSWSMNMPAFIGPGPNNPLGTRALNLSASGIRIHGTPDSDSIGGPASHGCIRMRMHEAEELFELVDVGTPVVIVGA